MRNAIELASQASRSNIGGDKKERERKTAIKEVLRLSTLKLRDKYYSVIQPKPECFETPYGGPITESVGPWPEFILRGLPCQKSQRGCCTPCFYSRMPRINKPAGEVYQSLVRQTEYILANFNFLVLRNQKGSFSWRKKRQPRGSSDPVAFVLTPIGSFFNPTEFPSWTRNEILTKVLGYSNNTKTPIALHIETHADDFIRAADNQDEFEETIDLLQKLNGRVLFGLESHDELVRNVLYNKFLNLGDFEHAARLAHQKDLGAGAFVFVGINPLRDVEMISDARKTIDYLRTVRVSPVLMFHNVQPYTIQELLYVYNQHSLPEPRTALEVVNYLIEGIEESKKEAIDSWLIADPIGGPPTPQFDMFNSRRSITCPECSVAIYNAIDRLRRDRNTKAFADTYKVLSSCECAERYLDLLENQLRNDGDLMQRCESMNVFIESRYDDYTGTVRNILDKKEDYKRLYENSPCDHTISDKQYAFASLKAELLCYGVNVDSGMAEKLSKYNSYVMEGGFVHAAHFLIDKEIMNTCVSELFCKHSPFFVKSVNGHYELMRKERSVALCKVLDMPVWCNETIKGVRIGDVIRPHSERVLSGMPNPICHYYAVGKQCKFCSLGPYQKFLPIDATTVAKMVLRAIEYDSNYEIALSGGTSKTTDRSAKYFARIAREVRKRSEAPMSIELVPPEHDDDIRVLHDCGVNALIMNIEIWNDELRRIFCPGKSDIPLGRYLEAIEFAVSLFGKGQVASVFIAGLQSNASILEGARRIIQLGAIPTIIPFKPFNDCALREFGTTNPRSVVEVSRAIGRMLIEAELAPGSQNGCTKCGGCSVESLCMMEA